MEKKYRSLVLCLGFAGFVSAADNWFVSPSLPAIAESFGVTAAAAGCILTAYMIPYGAMQPVYGYFSDRWSKFKLLRLIVLGLTLGTAGGALAPSLGMLSFWRVFTGFFAAGIIAVSLALIGDTVPAEKRQTYVGLFMGIVFAGQGVSAGLGGLITKYVSWRGAFAFFTLAGLLAFLLLLKGKPGNAHASAVSTSAEVDSTSSVLDSTSSVLDSMSSVLDSTSAEVGSNPPRGFFSALLRVLRAPLGFLFPFALAAGFLLLGIYGYLGAFLHERTGLDYLQGGMVVMFYGFACLLGGTRVGRLGSRFGKSRVILAGEVLALLSTILLLLAGQAGSWLVALPATILLGFGYISVQSSLATFALEVTPESTGLPSGLIGLGLFCGGGLGSTVGGLLLTQFGYSSLWLFFGGGLLLLIPVTLCLRWR